MRVALFSWAVVFMKRVLAAFGILVARDIKLAYRQESAATPLLFFILIVILFPFSLGTDTLLLQRVAPSLLWVALLLSLLLSLHRLFHDDYDEGVFDALRIAGISLPLLILAKAMAHWLTTALPLLLVLPIVGLMMNLDPSAAVPMMVTFLFASPGLTLLGGIGAALTLGGGRGGPLLALLVVPLYIPLLIFGALAIQAAPVSMAAFGRLSLAVIALTLLALSLAPVAIAAIIREQLN